MSFTGILNVSTVFFFLLLHLIASPLCLVSASHNITAILSHNPDFTEFSAALNSASLTAEIDRRTSITVLAVDNAVMAQLRAQHLPADAVGHTLAMHVLLDYYDDAKLHRLTVGSVLTASLLDASGLLNITARGGRVAFAPPYGMPDASLAGVYYQRSIKESPYDIAVVQVSGLISFPTAGTTQALGLGVDPFSPMLTSGCAMFASLFIASSAGVDEMYQRSLNGGGLTVFCPVDDVVTTFVPAFRNLTADSKVELLLYHAVATHYSEKALKKVNGEVNTLATDGGKSLKLTIKDGGATVKLSSSSGYEARVTRTISDIGPHAVYLIDGVLSPREVLDVSAGAAAQSPDRITSPAPAPGINRSPSPMSQTTPTPAPASAPVPMRALDNQRSKNGGMGWWSLLGTAVAASVPAIALVSW